MSKLAARYFGPYQIIKKADNVAYTLQLLESTKIHHTLHETMLKKHHGSLPPHSTMSDILPWEEESLEAKTPITLLDKKSLKRRNVAVV